MKYKNLGKNGPKVSLVGLGFWQAGGRQWRYSSPRWVKSVVEAAHIHGISLLDTAEIYGDGRSERLLGRALKELGLREEFIVASKIAGYRVFEWDIVKGIDGITRRLGSKPDIVQAHWPPPIIIDVCRVVRALEKAVTMGKTGYYGLSNYPGNLLAKALECSRRIEPVSNQIQYHLGYRSAENDVFPVAERNGIGILAWSPLAKGALAGLREPKDPAQKRDPVFKTIASDDRLQKTLEIIARKHDTSIAAVSLAWIISKGAIPIPGTRKPERVKEYASAADVELSSQDINLLDKVTSFYVSRWGDSYRALQYMRYIPCLLQRIGIKLMGGV